MKLIVVEKPSNHWYVTGCGGCVPEPWRMGIYVCGEQQISNRLRDWGLCGCGSPFIPRAKENHFKMTFAE